MPSSIVLRLSFAKKATLSIAGLGALAAPLVVGMVNASRIHAQSPVAAPIERFDVASVKAHVGDAGSGGYPGLAPGRQRFTATNLPLTALLLLAYDVTPGQISGVLNSLDAVGWDIEAKCDRPMTREQALRMMQTLLATRFKLELHREFREQPIYALLIAKGGPKLHESAEDSPVPLMEKKADGFSYKATPISTLTLVLSQQVGRTVIDKTGLIGRYDFTLEYERERSARGGPDRSEPAPSPGDLPSVFRALQEQLGLRLEPQKGSVEHIIVDHAEKASEN